MLAALGKQVMWDEPVNVSLILACSEAPMNFAGQQSINNFVDFLVVDVDSFFFLLTTLFKKKNFF